MAFASAYLLKHRGLYKRADVFFQTEILVVVLFPYIAWMLAVTVVRVNPANAAIGVELHA